MVCLHHRSAHGPVPLTNIQQHHHLALSSHTATGAQAIRLLLLPTTLGVTVRHMRHSASQCVCCRITLYGIKAASGGAHELARSSNSPGRRADPARCARPGGRARAGRPGGRGAHENRRPLILGLNLRLWPCRPIPSHVHGIVHVAPSMSRPLRAARGGLRPAWTSPPRRDQRPGRGECDAELRGLAALLSSRNWWGQCGAGVQNRFGLPGRPVRPRQDCKGCTMIVR